MATLGVSSEEFFDLSPVEFYYALKTTREFRRAASKEAYEIAREQAVWIINYTSTRLKDPFKSPTDMVKFVWENEPNKEKQSVDDMKRAITRIALMIGTKPEQEKVHINTK